MLSDFDLIQDCLACTNSSLIEVLNLGLQPLANSYRDVRETGIEQLFPLVFQVCEVCRHGQLTVAVDPVILYQNYSYVSGTTNTLLSNFEAFADEITKRKRNAKVLDIAANDGSFVRILQAHGHKAMGIDPAENLVEIAQKNGIPVECGYWCLEFAQDLGQKFDVITAMNVLGHVGNPFDFLQGCAWALADGGSIFIQTSQAFMITRGEFDTIYHEHHSFFNTTSMMSLAKRAGLTVVDGSYVDIHGTSYRWELKKSVIGSPVKLLTDEERRGLNEVSTYVRFAEIAQLRAIETKHIIEQQRSSGMLIGSYGAAAKAHTFFNFAGIKPDVVIDDNALKQGKLSPGSGVVIQNPEVLSRIESPVQHVISAWNFAQEIKGRIRKLRPEPNNDRFLQYFPEVSNSGD